ncbi:MAG: hypothetical protein CSA96_06885 [Bacteroidetes bacterium]|nr:MAG: hypothetical protein CSA96_06885 [Bacteroidota bacterium]
MNIKSQDMTTIIGQLKMNVTKVLKNMKKAYKCHNMDDLAEIMQVSKTTFGTWRNRKKIPKKYILECSQMTKVDYECLLDEDKYDKSQLILGNNNIQTLGNNNTIKTQQSTSEYQNLFKLIEEYATPKLIREFEEKLLKIRKAHED